MNEGEFQLERPATEPGVWMLDPDVIFLNHGSFGSCPRAALDFQRELREQMEREPVRFLARELEGMLDEARGAMAEFLGAKVENLVFVQNATAGVNSVLRSLAFEAGDELLVTDHEYRACRNALEFVAERSRAKVVVAHVPFPCQSSNEAVAAILNCVTPRTRLALVDHVTSQTGMVMPIETIVRGLTERGVDTLVDAAHAAGMVPVNVELLGAAYYTGNCHKWLCAPKTAAFLHVRADRQKLIRPLAISHGATSSRKDRSRFLIEFAWMGTGDPTAILSVPKALRYLESLVPGGWPALMARNRALALAGRRILCERLNVPAPCPEECVGSMASVPVADAREKEGLAGPLYIDPLQTRLMERHGIEVPLVPWPAWPKRLIRISAQLYNSLPEYERLAEALLQEVK